MSLEVIGVLLVAVAATYPLRFIWLVFTKLESEATTASANGIKRSVSTILRSIKRSVSMFSRTARIARKVDVGIDADYAWQAAWAQYAAMVITSRSAEQYPGNSGANAV